MEGGGASCNIFSFCFNRFGIGAFQGFMRNILGNLMNMVQFEEEMLLQYD